MPNRESRSTADQERLERAQARNAVIAGGLSEETMAKVEQRLSNVDWRALAAAQDTLFMAANGTGGIRHFWTLPGEDGQTYEEQMITTNTPNELASRMYGYALQINHARSA